MKQKHTFTLLTLQLLVALTLASCDEAINAPVLPDAVSIDLPEAVTLDEDKLFGVWKGKLSYGYDNNNYFEEEYSIEFQTVEDAEAVYSHWYTDASTGISDSICDLEYTYEFDGATVVLTPKTTAAAAGATTITGIHTGNEKLLLTIVHNGITDSICTLTRYGDPEPSITNVSHTLPVAGDLLTITGRNLQSVDGVFLPITGGELEITDFTPGSKQISFTLPEADYAQGSIRLQAQSAGVNCYSPAYMFCYNCVFFHNFISDGYSSPYTGSEFEYSLSSMGTLKDNAYNLSSANLPEGHSLLQAQGINHPDSLLSFYGSSPVAWPQASGSDDKLGYLRFSSADRFQYVLDNCDGLISSNTACTDLAIQMDLYVYSNGTPEWNSGYISWRLNKDRSAIDAEMSANVAGWERDEPLSFADGWRTYTIPLSAFSVTSGSAASTIGGLIEQLKSSDLQTILTVVNYTLDASHPSQALDSFQFNMANIRLVPYTTPANTAIE